VALLVDVRENSGVSDNDVSDTRVLGSGCRRRVDDDANDGNVVGE
jgi:hypothetical protein